MKITEDQRLQALALYTMAKHHNGECERYYTGLLRLLGKNRDEDDGRVSDAIWGFDSPGSPAEFDELLQKMQIEVEAPSAP